MNSPVYTHKPISPIYVGGSPVPAPSISGRVAEIRSDVISLRRRFHAMPELGFKEFATAASIAAELQSLGFQVSTGVGGTGVIGSLSTGKPGPTLMFRADIDGLPVAELTGLPFASTNGSMHACGHDGHIAVALGAARLLSSLRSTLRGTLVFVFQPAEEIVGGAAAMLTDGLFNTVKPDRVVGLHIWNQLPSGKVGVNPGSVFASADAFRVTVTGKGGHGALPHLSVDPVVAAAQIVSASQTAVSREVPPNEMGVVTFGQVHGGSAPNVIADSVVLEGTIRAYRPAVRDLLHAAIARISSGVASGLRCEARFEFLYGTPPVINNPEVASWVASHAMAAAGEENVSEHEPVSVGDDVSEFINRVPGCYFLLGAAKDGAQSHHNARFDFDESCLGLGVEIFSRAAIDYLKS